MVGGLGVGELLLGAALPAIGLGAEVLDGVECVAVAEEGGDVGGQVLDGDAADESVAVRAPGPGGLGGDDADEGGGDGDAGEGGQAGHEGSIARGYVYKVISWGW